MGEASLEVPHGTRCATVCHGLVIAVSESTSDTLGKHMKITVRSGVAMTALHNEKVTHEHHRQHARST